MEVVVVGTCLLCTTAGSGALLPTSIINQLQQVPVCRCCCCCCRRRCCTSHPHMPGVVSSRLQVSQKQQQWQCASCFQKIALCCDVSHDEACTAVAMHSGKTATAAAGGKHSPAHSNSLQQPLGAAHQYMNSSDCPSLFDIHTYFVSWNYCPQPSA